MLRRIVGLALVAGLAAGTAGSVGAQSTGVDERSLLQKAEQNPQEIMALIDLVRLYVEQGRLAEADQMLRRTSLAIQRARGVAAPERVAPTVSFDPSVPVRIGGDIREPAKIRDVRPVYPEEAKEARVQGIVILEATIDETGAVSDARVLRSVPMLDEPALDAVLQWRFTPTVLNGVPVPVIMTVTVNFTLS